MVTGDCCDTLADGCPFPAEVNPGALELAGNGVDDDCDASVDVVPSTACSATSSFSAVTATQLAQALDVCRTTTLNPPLPQRTWGLVSARLAFANSAVPSAAQLSNMQNFQVAVMAGFGANNPPRANLTFAALSSGRARDSGDPGFVAPQGGMDWARSVVPTLMLTAPSCASSPNAHDSVNVELTIRVPTNVSGITLDHRFFDAEFPDACTSTNDQAQIRLTSNAVGVPPNGNIAFDAIGNPLSVNTVSWESCVPSGVFTCPAGTAGIQGTGFDFPIGATSAGAATNWRAARSPVLPGETITLQLIVFDVSDGAVDATLLVDNLGWILPRVFANGFE